jgi:hypothetical protein
MITERHAGRKHKKHQQQQQQAVENSPEKGTVKAQGIGDAVDQLLDIVEGDLGKENEEAAARWEVSTATQAEPDHAHGDERVGTPDERAGDAQNPMSVAGGCTGQAPALAERRLEGQAGLGTPDGVAESKATEKTKKRKNHRHSAPEVGYPRSPAGRSSRSLHEVDSFVGTEAELALSSAMLTVQQTPPHKRRISFNLERNVVHKIGEPLPPAELRTPPSARPNGSALKKVSSLPRGDGTSKRRSL